MSLGKEPNINTADYWNARFGMGDWALQGGHSQTRMFAEAQLPLIRISAEFTGSILDFGCGAGDAFPVYRQAWPQAKLIGIDFSAAAIRICQERFGKLAEFVCGDIGAAPEVDVVICSNVLEHLDDDKVVVHRLLKQCKTLYAIVPYKECPLSNEHVRCYEDNAFSEFAVTRKVIFKSRGWTELGIRAIAGIFLENISRYFKGQPMRLRRRQILFEITANAVRP